MCSFSKLFFSRGLNFAGCLRLGKIEDRSRRPCSAGAVEVAAGRAAAACVRLAALRVLAAVVPLAMVVAAATAPVGAAG